jgi:hypothetical protein
VLLLLRLRLLLLQQPHQSLHHRRCRPPRWPVHDPAQATREHVTEPVVRAVVVVAAAAGDRPMSGGSTVRQQ